MPNKTMKTKIQVRRDTTANWLTNKDVVPAAGEPCFDLELGTLKIGDGVTSYENLKEISGGQAAHYEGVIRASSLLRAQTAIRQLTTRCM